MSATETKSSKSGLGSKVFTTGQVAKICNVATRTVSKWFDSGRLKGYRIPGSNDRRIPYTTLVEFLRDNGFPLAGLENAVFRRVLVLSTDYKLVATLTELLPANLYRVQLASSAFEAGVFCRDFKPHIIVLDARCGRSEVLHVAGSSLIQNGVPVFRLGIANEDESDLADWERRGVGATLKRPFDPKDLAAAVQATEGKETL